MLVASLEAMLSKWETDMGGGKCAELLVPLATAEVKSLFNTTIGMARQGYLTGALL